jgi:hypothetical protein
MARAGRRFSSAWARRAAKTGRPLYFTRFTVNQRGRVSGILKGPVDCRDPESAMGKFKAFSS